MSRSIRASAHSASPGSGRWRGWRRSARPSRPMATASSLRAGAMRWPARRRTNCCATSARPRRSISPGGRTSRLGGGLRGCGALRRQRQRHGASRGGGRRAVRHRLRPLESSRLGAVWGGRMQSGRSLDLPVGARVVVVRSTIACSPCFYTGYTLGRPEGCPSRNCLDHVQASDVLVVANQLLHSPILFDNRSGTVHRVGGGE